MYIYNNIYDYKYNIHTCRCMYEDYIYLDLRVVSNFWVYPVLIHSHVFSRMCFCPFWGFQDPWLLFSRRTLNAALTTLGRGRQWQICLDLLRWPAADRIRASSRFHPQMMPNLMGKWSTIKCVQNQFDTWTPSANLTETKHLSVLSRDGLDA